jgi:hypothetical protein
MVAVEPEEVSMRKIIFAFLLFVGFASGGPATQPTIDDMEAGAQQPKTVDRIYDVRDYLYRAEDYPVVPAKPTTRPQPNPADGAENNLKSTFNTQSQTPQDELDELIKLITNTVAPDTWKDAGGSVGSITELAGKLYVTTTPDLQAQIRKLITDVTSDANRCLHVSASWLLLTEDELSALCDPASATDGMTRLSDAALQKAPAAARAHLLCIDEQTAHITAGPPSGKIILQIKPEISSSGKEVFLDVLNQMACSNEFHTTARIPLGEEIVIGGVTTEVGGKDQPKQLYLVMRADAK